jgi:MoaA/NifB/PqqE/SkfB family radical SAM enzyme
MLKIPNDSFCMLPFVHLHVDEQNDIKLCCNASESIKKYSNEFNFDTDPDLVDVRNKMLAGEKVKYCNRCYDIDQLGAKSFRYYHSNEWITNLKIEKVSDITTDLIFYDVRNDNTCNLGCRMCGPGFSSQLEKEFIKLNWLAPTFRQKYKLNEIINLQKIKKLYVAGGEPTLMPEFKEFLEQAVKENRTDIELRIITNGTNINKEFAMLLSNFPNKEFTISIDGYDQVNRYIRWPSNWISLVENIKRLYEITDRISFNVTVTMWNISVLSKLIYFLDKEFNSSNIFLSIDEGMNSPFNFPNKELVLEDLEKLKNTTSYKIDKFKDRVEYFITRITNTEIDKEKLKNFFEYNDTLDRSRNVKLVDYIPELEECRKSITKRI